MDNMYYDIGKTLSYNCLFNFIVGNRGCGKTYGFKDWAIRSYLRNGGQFVYIRRYKDELSEVHKFFDDIRLEYPDHQLETKNGVFLIDRKPAGYYMPLSTAKIHKSVPYPNVDKVCFDEFILDKGVYHYLPDEVTSFLELYETIARMRDVRAFFLSNAITVTNPYFLYFDISLPYGKLISAENDKLIELVQNPDFVDTKLQTRFGRMMQGTEYANYAIENQFLRDNKNFVMKKSGTASFYFMFSYLDTWYGVWIDYKKGLLFVSKDYDPSCPVRYALTNDDHKPNTLFLKNPRKSSFFEMFCRQYMCGNVRFETVQIKNVCNQVIKWTL